MVPDALHLALKLHAVTQEVTMNTVFLDAVEMYMQSISNTVKMDSKSADWALISERFLSIPVTHS
jgi:hypothetical protein